MAIIKNNQKLLVNTRIMIVRALAMVKSLVRWISLLDLSIIFHHKGDTANITRGGILDINDISSVEKPLTELRKTTNIP